MRVLLATTIVLLTLLTSCGYETDTHSSQAQSISLMASPGVIVVETFVLSKGTTYQERQFDSELFFIKKIVTSSIAPASPVRLRTIIKAIPVNIFIDLLEAHGVAKEDIDEITEKAASPSYNTFSKKVSDSLRSALTEAYHDKHGFCFVINAFGEVDKRVYLK